MNRILRSVAVLAAVFAAASTAHAQARAATGSTELGVDGELGFNRFPGDNSTIISLPLQRFRIGFNADQQLEWEPWGALNYISADRSSATVLGLGFGALWHLNTNRAETQWYVRPFVDLTHTSTSQDLQNGGTLTFSTTQWGLGAGVGAKLPITDRFAARLEGNLDHRFQDGNNSPAGNIIGLLAGLSFFTH